MAQGQCWWKVCSCAKLCICFKISTCEKSIFRCFKVSKFAIVYTVCDSDLLLSTIQIDVSFSYFSAAVKVIHLHISNLFREMFHYQMALATFPFCCSYHCCYISGTETDGESQRPVSSQDVGSEEEAGEKVPDRKVASAVPNQSDSWTFSICHYVLPSDNILHCFTNICTCGNLFIYRLKEAC